MTEKRCVHLVEQLNDGVIVSGTYVIEDETWDRYYLAYHRECSVQKSDPRLHLSHASAASAVRRLLLAAGLRDEPDEPISVPAFSVLRRPDESRWAA